jgi:hypothetical protein
MVPVGTILDLLVNKNNIIIPDGFLLCDGTEITDDVYIELFLQLEDDFTKSSTKLPNLPNTIVDDKLIIVKIIRASNDIIEDDNVDYVGNAEFIINETN